MKNIFAFLIASLLAFPAHAEIAKVTSSGGGGGGSGTVTSASVVSANGLAGTVATATTTPAITLTTTVTGVLKGNGTAISAATAGTDYAGIGSANAFTGWQSGVPETLTISTATFTPDNGAQNYSFTLVHASCPCTLANPSTTPVPGTSGMFAITQSSTGSDIIGTWGSDYQAAGGTANITLSTTANAVDLVPYYVVSSSVIVLEGVIRGVSH